jgi:hypothetical protein
MSPAMTPNTLSEKIMNTHRNLPWAAFAALAAMVLAAPSVNAQTISTSTPSATGTVNALPAATSVKSVGSVGLAASAVNLSGVVKVIANYIPNPDGSLATLAYFIDATGVSGTDSAGDVYVAPSAQANATRPYALSDTLNITLPFFSKARGMLSARTMLLTLNVTIDPTTHAVSSVTSSIGTP